MKDEKVKNLVFFPWITVLRAMGMSLVLWSHLCVWYLTENGMTSQFSYIFWERYVVEPFQLQQSAGYLGVMIFFLVSGWVITHVSYFDSPKAFLWKRIFRIFPVLVLSFLVVKLIYLISQFFALPAPLGYGSDRFLDYIYNLLLMNYFIGTPAVLPVTWTLAVEWMYYGLTLIFMRYTLKEPVKATFYMICLNIIAILLWPWQFTIYLVFILYIIFGRILYLKIMRKITSLEACALGGFCITAFVSLYQWTTPYKNWGDFSLAVVSLAWGVVVFFLAMILIRTNGKIGKFVGDISYSAYLFHLPVGSFILNFILIKLHTGFEIAAFFCVLGTFLFSYLSYRWVEVPMQRFSRAMLKK